MKNIHFLRVFTFVFLCAWFGQTQNAFSGVGDTTVVQTIRFDTTMRAGMFRFPDDSTKTYEKIIMRYSMRCKGGLVSTTTQRNLGCGEWDYNCYTYIIDSTQTDSLRRTTGSFAISNNTDSIFEYTTQPVWRYVRYNQQDVIYTNVISETTATPASGTTTLTHPLSPATAIRKAQYLWTAAELNTAGLAAGNITGIRLQLLSIGTTLENLRIRIKTSSQTVLNPDSPETSGFSEVYFLNTSISATGTRPFNFSNPYSWDGISNLLLEFSYTLPAPGTGNDVRGHNAGFTANLISDQPDSWLSFHGDGNFLQPDSSGFSTISDRVSVAFWAFGDPLRLPANTIAVSGTDSMNNRQINVHLPWSDTTVYWDCGGTASSYDRISKHALLSDIRGQWNFWTFTKNATMGVMKIFLNGQEWMSDTGKTKLIDLRKLIIGMAANNSNPYRGDLDEFSLWNTDLDSTAISGIMFHDISPTHPDYANLLAYYKMNENSGTTAYDSGPHGTNAHITNPFWKHAGGQELRRNFVSTNFRPDITFVQGVYTTSIQNYTVLDSTPEPSNSLIAYLVVNNSLQVIDTNYVWPSGYAYITDSAGAALDSIAIAATDTATVTTLVYYDKRPMFIELINFITPYGINLDFDGLKGKTWEFDVTDYTPLLKGMRYLAMGSGIYQEENDIQFVFYEGTPPRDVKSVTQIWPNATWTDVSYNNIYNNTYFEPRQVPLSASASQFKIRSMISGHGQQGEFVSRNHTISVNGTTNFTRAVWTECSTNPIYPQGGTWIYDRAGWCPGSAVVLKEYEITPYVTPGQTATLDYSLPLNSNPGTSNYRVNNQLVTYGAPNFSLDASVYLIKTPTKRTEYIRFNPNCDDPVIAIRNTGSTPLTSLDISYGRAGGVMSIYNWTGNLNFLDSDEVTLPAPGWLTSGTDRFVVSISNPNGGTDQYPANDTMSSAFDITDMYTGGLVFEIKTNNSPAQDGYTIKDSQGITVLARNGGASNTTYRDTLFLNTGCYKLYLHDGGNDGLSFWNNPSQGNGTFKILSAVSPVILKTFNPDFGDNINYNFTINYSLPVPEFTNQEPSLKIYPNPASNYFVAEIRAPRYAEANITMMNMFGQIVRQETIRINQSIEKVELDVSLLQQGVYFVRMQSGNFQDVQKVVINK